MYYRHLEIGDLPDPKYESNDEDYSEVYSYVFFI